MILNINVLPAIIKEVPHIIRCEELVRTLSDELQVKVGLPKNLAQHRIYFDRRDAKAEVALAAIVKTLNATLVKTSKGFEVERTTADLKEIRQRRVSQHLKWLERRFEAIDAFHKANPDSNESLVSAFKRDALILEQVNGGTRLSFPLSTGATLLPIATLLEKMILRIGLPAIAEVPNGQVRVYEDFPGPLALPLPQHADLLQSYISISNRLVEGDVGQAISQVVAVAGGSALFDGLPPTPSKISRLRLQQNSGENGIAFRLEAYDAGGHKIDSSYFFAGPAENRDGTAVYLQQEAVNPASRWKSLSPDALETLQGLKSSPAKLLDWYFDPVKQEPLDSFVREAVSYLSETKSAKCVAFDVIDSFWNPVTRCVIKGRLNVDALEKTVENWLPYEKLETTEAIVWRPVDPEIAEARQADRNALARFGKSIALHPIPDLRTTARLYHDASREPGTLRELWTNLALRSSEVPQGGTLTEESYRLLGGIGDVQWNELLSGKSLTAAQLGVTDNLRRLLNEEPGLSMVSERPIPDLSRHPMELYRSEALASTQISLRPVQTSVVRIWLSSQKAEGNYWSAISSLENIMRIPYQVFRRKDGQWVNRMPRETFEKGLSAYRFRRGVKTMLQLVIGLPASCRLVGEAPGIVTSERDSFTYADLPESIRDANWKKACDDALAEAIRHAGPGSQ